MALTSREFSGRLIKLVSISIGAAVITVGGASPIDPSKPWPVTRFARDGTLLDTIALLYTYSTELESGEQPVVNPVSDGAISSLTPSGTEFIVVDRRIPGRGDRGAYTISWIRMPEGDTLQRHSAEYRVRPIPREQVVEMTNRLAGSGAPRAYVEQVRDLLRRQAFTPPVSRVYAADGAVWLARETLGRADVRWERFTRNHGLTGYVTLPWKSRIVAERNGRVWVLEKDDFDVRYVTRYLFH